MGAEELTIGFLRAAACTLCGKPTSPHGGAASRESVHRHAPDEPCIDGRCPMLTRLNHVQGLRALERMRTW